MKRCLLVVFYLFIQLSLMGQQYIEGLIQNQKEEPLGFAHTYNKDLGVGHVSNISGRFRLLVRKGDTIRFSHTGYNTKELVLESVHLINYLKVTLTEDSLLLPSITIYSDPYFKVPVNFRGESMEIDGIQKPSGEPIRPGTIGGPSEGGIGLTLYGPITFFSKDAREQRKAQAAYEETDKTIFYQKFIESDTVRQKLCDIYNINSEQYDRIIVTAHLNHPEVQTIQEANELWYWLLFYFKNKVGR